MAGTLVNLNPNGNLFNGLWNSENVVVTIPSGQLPSRIQFPDIQNLRDTRLSRIKTYSTNEVEASLGGIPTIPSSFIPKAFITLQTYNGRQKIHEMPLSDIWNFFGNAINIPNFLGLRVDWPKSYIEIQWGATPAFPQDTNFVFNIEYYLDPKQELSDLAAEFSNKS